MGNNSQLRQTDAAIISSGLLGYLLGASLSDAGLRVTVLELQGRLRGPETQPASLLCVPTLLKIQKAHGQDAVRLYAMQLQEQLRALTASPLPYVHSLPAYAFARTEEESTLLDRYEALLSGLMLPAHVTTDTGGGPFPAAQSLMMPGQAVVNVPWWIETLQLSIRRMGGRILTEVQHLELDGTQVLTEHGRLSARHIILDTDKPLGLHSRQLLALLESRLIAQCSLSPPWPLCSLQQSMDSTFHLLPSPGGASILWDAGRTGSAHLLHRCKQFPQRLSAGMPDWPQKSLQYFTHVISADGLPLIGILPETQHLFACGFGENAILGAMHAADTLTRRILGKTRMEDRMYEPNRIISRALQQTAQLRNVHRHATGMLHPHMPTCPHCGCKLRYFPPDQHWACAYCGSGYAAFGTALYGPAIRPAEISASHRPF